MKQSDPLQLLEPGSLAKPGPVGRIVRLLIGLACLYALFQLVLHRTSIIAMPASVLPNIAIMVLPPLLILNYVVNIGFGKSWGRWPSYVSVAALLVLALVSWLLFGTFDHALLGVGLWLWLVYFYSHLGASFVLAALNATPGCEMRAIPELIGKARGQPVREHHCPAFLARIDAWEQRRQAAGR